MFCAVKSNSPLSAPRDDTARALRKRAENDFLSIGRMVLGLVSELRWLAGAPGREHLQRRGGVLISLPRRRHSGAPESLLRFQGRSAFSSLEPGSGAGRHVKGPRDEPRIHDTQPSGDNFSQVAALRCA